MYLSRISWIKDSKNNVYHYNSCMAYFAFKERVEDFIVEEILETPSGKGEFHYVFFEKKNLATFDVIRMLHDEF